MRNEIIEKWTWLVFDEKLGESASREKVDWKGWLWKELEKVASEKRTKDGQL